METQNKEDLKKGMRTIWTIWVCLFLSLYAYIRACYAIQEDIPFLSDSNLPLVAIRNGFFLLSIVLLITTHYIRKNMLGKQSEKSEEKIIRHAEKMDKPVSVVKYIGVIIVSLALSEFIGILGFSYFLVSGDFETLYILMLISAVSMVYFRPKMKELELLSSTLINPLQDVISA